MRRRGLALVGLLLLAAFVRLYWIAQPRIVWGDEPFYLWLGDSLVHGRGYQFYGISGAHFSPLFPLLTGALARLMPGSLPLQSASNALYVVCGALLVYPVYGFARRLTGNAAALRAALLIAVYPALTAGIPWWGTMTEPLYLLLIATAWWALLFALQDGKWWAYGMAGMLLGLAYLTRTEAIIYVVAGCGMVALFQLFAEGRSRPLWGPLLGKFALVLVTFFVMISPYLLVLHALTGKWQLAEEAGSTYLSAQGLAFGDVAAFDRATWGLDRGSGEVYLFSPASESQGLLDAIRSDPWGFLRLLRANLRDLGDTFFSARLLPWYLLPLIALGLFASAWDRRRLKGELLLLASFAGPLSFLPFFVQDRYIAAALLPALIWAGAGLAWLGQWLALTFRGDAELLQWDSQARDSQTWGILPALLVAVVLLWEGRQLHATLQNTGSFQPGHLLVAEQLRETGAADDAVLLARYPAIAFHAGVGWAPTPAAEWKDVLTYAQRKGATYLALDANEARLRPQLAFLLDAASVPDELEWVAREDTGRGAVVLYRFR